MAHTKNDDTMYSKKLVFTAACLGMLLFGIVFLSLGSVNNMLSDRFGLSNQEIGTLAALLPLGILIGSLVFGPVVDRFGYRWMLVGASLLVGLALEGLAFAADERLVQIFIFLIGLGRRRFERGDERTRGRRKRRRARSEAQPAGRVFWNRGTHDAQRDCATFPEVRIIQHRGGHRRTSSRSDRVLPDNCVPAPEAAVRQVTDIAGARPAWRPDIFLCRSGDGDSKRDGRHVERLDDTVLEKRYAG